MNTHEGYSKKTISNANVLLAGGGDKSLGDFLSGIQYVSASKKIQYKTATDNASWLDLVTLVTTDENVKQVDNNNNLNSPILIKNGTGTGTITSSVLYADGVTINPSNNSITSGILFSTSYIQASTYIKASTYMEAAEGFKKGSIGNSHVLLAGGGDADIEDFLSIGRIIVHPHNNDINSLYSVRFNGVKYTNAARGHNCFVFNKGDLAFVQYTKYDTYGSEDATNELATYLNNLVDKIVVIVSYDACRINSNLRTALKNLGGFQVGTFNAARYCHYFIGMTNCPEGRGYEDYGYSTYFSAKVECLIYLNKGIALNPIKIYSVNKVFNAYNADHVDWSGLSNIPSTFTPSSHTHNINDIKWPGGHNLIATAAANSQEWSIDLTPGTYTGTYWHVWRATTSGVSTSGTLLKVDSDTGKVSAPYGFVGSLTGNASTASKWASSITLSLTGSVTGSVSIDGSGNVSLVTTTNHNHDSRYMRTFGTIGSSNALFDVDADPGYEGTITYDPVATNMAAKIESNPNVTALNLGNNFGRRKLLLFMYDNDNIYYRRHVYNSATNIIWTTAVKLLHTGNTYVSNNKGYINSVEITKVDTSDTSDWAKLLKPIASTTTASASTWNIPSGCKQVWGERFSDSTLKYTPSGGSATTITDTGDWTIWLAPSATSNSASLNMRIDGTYYGSFSGNLSGNASTASKWASSITLSLTGSVTGSASIDGSGNVSLATTTNHTHSNIVSLGNKSASDLSSTYPSGLSTHGIYNNGYPFSYGCGITSMANGGAFQIAGQWNSGVTGTDNCDFPTEMYIRGRRDSYDVWTTWTRVLTNRNWSSVITLPTVNNGTLSLLASGTTKTTFTANQSGNSTFNIATGSSNGTISVGGTDVAVKGLGSAAYLANTDFVRAYGTSNANIDDNWGLSVKTFDPIPSGTPPELNPNITLLSLGDNYGRRKMLAFTYSNDNIYYRRRRIENNVAEFTAWVKILHTGNVSPSLPISGNTIAVTVGGLTSSYITVPYASNADTVDGKHASDFALTGHTHSYLPVVGTIGMPNIVNDPGLCVYTFDGNPSTIPSGVTLNNNSWNLTWLILGPGSTRRKRLTFAYESDIIYYDRKTDSGWTTAVLLIHSGGGQTINGNLTATNFYTTSDRNKKTNISSFSEHIRKFQLKDTEKWHYGVIAQEVEEMFRDGEEGNMTVNYNSILSFYIGSLENSVAGLEDAKRLLENKVKILEERIKRLESK